MLLPFLKFSRRNKISIFKHTQCLFCCWWFVFFSFHFWKTHECISFEGGFWRGNFINEVYASINSANEMLFSVKKMENVVNAIVQCT